MNIDKKVAHYLRNTWIDFQTFYILDIIPQNKDDAVVILCPLYPAEDKVFFVWRKGREGRARATPAVLEKDCSSRKSLLPQSLRNLSKPTRPK